MTALKSRDIDAFLKSPDPAMPIILVYGPDAGLVRERADQLIASAVDNVDDPFSLVRMEGDELANEPSRLVDEAMTVALFGGRRAIRVRAGGRNFNPGVQVLIDTPPRDCRIVIEAGDLKPSAPLRALCEKAKSAVTIPCYADQDRDIARLIDDEIRAANLRIASEARNFLVGLLGGDRQASRNEIRKLALYAHGKNEVTLDDVRNIVTDASALEVDAIIDAALTGKTFDADHEFERAVAAGIYPGALTSSLLRHVSQLHRACLAMDRGQSMDEALRTQFARLHFSRKPAVESSLRLWTVEKLHRLIVQLGEAGLEIRRNNDMAAAIAQRLLISISTSARARR